MSQFTLTEAFEVLSEAVPAGSRRRRTACIALDAAFGPLYYRRIPQRPDIVFHPLQRYLACSGLGRSFEFRVYGLGFRV